MREMTEVRIDYKPGYNVRLLTETRGGVAQFYEMQIEHMSTDASKLDRPSMSLDIRQQCMIEGTYAMPEHRAILREWIIDCFEQAELHEMSEFLKIDHKYAVMPSHEEPLYNRRRT